MGSWNSVSLEVLYDVCNVFAWIAFVLWPISFYPQVILNFRRKSVVGLNFDFVVLNLTKHSSYLIYNVSIFFSSAVQRQYHRRYEMIPTVAVNDVAFSTHAVTLTALTFFLIATYDHGNQKVSKTAIEIVTVAWLSVAVCAFVAFPKHSWLWLWIVSSFNTLQVVMTVINYIPQAVMNFRRKSTIGIPTWILGKTLLSLELGQEKGGALEKLQGAKFPKRGSEGIAIENAAEITQERSKCKETDVPIVMGLECTKVRSSGTKTSRQIDNESLDPIGDLKQIDAAIDCRQETKQSGDGDGSLKRKRGRPPISTPTVMGPNGDHSKDESSCPVELAIMVNEDGKEQLEVEMGRTRKRARTRKMPATKLSSEKTGQSLFQQHEKHSIKWGKRQTEKGGALEKLQGAKFPKRGSEGIAIENAAEITQERSKCKETDVPIVMGLECTKVRSSGTKTSRQIDNESLDPIGDLKQIDAAIDCRQETKQSGDGDGSLKRKRGRPPISTPTVMGPNGDHSKDESSCPVELAIMVNEDGKEQLEVEMGRTRKRARTRKMPATKLSSEKTGQSLFQQHEKHYIKWGKRQTEKGGALEKLQGAKFPKRGSKGIAIENAAEITQERSKCKETDVPIVMGLECTKVRSSGTKTSRQIDNESLDPIGDLKQIDAAIDCRQETKQSGDGDRQTESVNIESQAQGSVDTSVVKTVESNRIASDGEEVLAEYNKLDDQPLAKRFEEMQSPTSVDGSRVAPACEAKQCAEMREKQDMPIQTPVNGTPTIQTETQSLPFIKDSDVWSLFETMAIFQKFPQKPHFRPLELCKESKREGLAIGCMVTFSSIAEKTYRDDPRSAIEEKLETLSDLEKHGFEVQPVRDHLTLLLAMKDKKEKLEAWAADIDNQIIVHNTDKEKIEQEIEENNKQIAELQHKNSVAISRKEVMEREIDGLRSLLWLMKNGLLL